MSKRIPMIDGWEYDALTKWHFVIKWCYKSGMRHWVKRKYRRRERHIAKIELRKQLKAINGDIDAEY